MVSGIININKEVGISSQKCVSQIKKILGEKCGHTGTLDLEAGGVLPIVVGRATRISQYLMDEDKDYLVDVKFGARTDTLDYSGEVLQRGEVNFSREDLEDTLKAFTGEIEQTPPMYSALKVQGKKLYELAREGKTVERKTRKVKIYKLDLLTFEGDFAQIQVTCSKGTYVRSLVDDIGESLGSFAYVNSLTRTRVGAFKIEEAIKSSDLSSYSGEELLKELVPMDLPLKSSYQSLRLDEKAFDSLINGRKIPTKEEENPGPLLIYAGETFMGLGQIQKGQRNNFVKIDRVLYDR